MRSHTKLAARAKQDSLNLDWPLLARFDARATKLIHSNQISARDKRSRLSRFISSFTFSPSINKLLSCCCCRFRVQRTTNTETTKKPRSVAYVGSFGARIFHQLNSIVCLFIERSVGEKRNEKRGEKLLSLSLFCSLDAEFVSISASLFCSRAKLELISYSAHEVRR